jgi:hypothetical protein
MFILCILIGSSEVGYTISSISRVKNPQQTVTTTGGVFGFYDLMGEEATETVVTEEQFEGNGDDWKRMERWKMD